MKKTLLLLSVSFLVFSFEKSAAKHCYANFNIGGVIYFAPFNGPYVNVDTLLSPDNSINLPITFSSMSDMCPTCPIDTISWIHNSAVISHSPSYTITDTGLYYIRANVANYDLYCLGPYYWELTLRVGYAVSTSVNEINNTSSFNLYPNPFTNNFTLEIKTAKASALSYQIYDCTGREIKEVNKENIFGEVKLTEDFESMSKGIYFLRMRIGEAVYERKLVRL